MKNFNGISEDKVDELIMNYLSTNKFQTSLNSLIISTLSQKNNMNLTRQNIADKILSHQYIKDVENEILQNLFNTFEIENYNTEELINLKYKNLLNREKDNIGNNISINSNSPLNSVNSTMNNNITSVRLLNILVDEFLSCEFSKDNNIKIESYIGDLSNFDSETLINCDRIEDVFKKINTFLSKSYAKDMFLIPNLINFVNKITKNTNTKILCEAITIFLDYFNNIVGKFYLSQFDITKFYKLSFNVECLNKMITKFYDNDVFLRKIDEKYLQHIIDKIFETIMKNYSPNNPVYI